MGKSLQNQLRIWVEINRLPSAVAVADFLNQFHSHGDEIREVDNRDKDEIVPGLDKSTLIGREKEVKEWVKKRLLEYSITGSGRTFFMNSQFRKEPKVCKSYEEAKEQMLTRINTRFRDHFLRTAESLAKKIAKKNRK